MPRPRILDEEKQQDLCQLIHAGFTLDAAARHIGCSVFTVRREARRNQQFDRCLRHAKFAQELNPVGTLREAAARDWRAAAWLLERTQPQQYARRTASSFSPLDVAELLDRVCEAVGQETSDPQVSARIKRRALALANSRLGLQQGNPFRVELPAPEPSIQTVPTDQSLPSSESRESNGGNRGAQPDKNEPVVLSRASDLARIKVPVDAAPGAA